MEKFTQYIKKKFFPGLTLLLAGFLAGNADPELYIPFFLEAAGHFLRMYLWKPMENRSRRNRLSFADSLDARWIFSGSNLWFYCIWSPYGNYGDAFYRNWTGNRIFHVYSAVRTYRRRSCRSTSFSALSDLSAIMGFGVSDGLQESMGIWRNQWNFSTESKRLSPRKCSYIQLYTVWEFFWNGCVNPWILNKIMDFSKFFE